MSLKRNIYPIAALICILIAANNAAAQLQDVTQKAKVGVTAAIQASQLDIIVPMWLNSRFVFSPSVGVSTISDAATDTRLMFLLRYNIRTGSAVPYVGARIGVLTVSPKGGHSESDTILGAAAGGEYFFSKNFSAGVEAQVNAALSGDKSSRFGNPGGTNINTATSALVTFYF